MASPSTVKAPSSLALLWLHEATRVYSDCLVDEDDIKKFRGLLAQIVKRRFPQFSLSSYVVSAAHKCRAKLAIICA